MTVIKSNTRWIDSYDDEIRVALQQHLTNRDWSYHEKAVRNLFASILNDAADGNITLPSQAEIMSKMLLQARSIKGRPPPGIQINHVMDSLERRQLQWIPYSNFPPAATAPRHEGTGTHAPGDHGERDQGRAGRHGLRGRGHRTQRLPRARLATPLATSSCAYPSSSRAPSPCRA